MAAGTKIMPTAHIFYSQAGKSVSRKTLLKTVSIQLHQGETKLSVSR